jgi:hypothetical protein
VRITHPTHSPVHNVTFFVDRRNCGLAAAVTVNSARLKAENYLFVHGTPTSRYLKRTLKMSLDRYEAISEKNMSGRFRFFYERPRISRST